MNNLDNGILLGIVSMIGAAFAAMLKYISSFKKSVQFKDVCKAKHKGLDDCIESEMRRNTERYDALDKKIDGLTELVRNGQRKSQ